MGATHMFAGLPVSNFAAALSWYEQLLGRSPDRLPKAGEAVWQLTDTSLLYIVEDTPRAGGGLVTIAVSDLDQHLAELVERGIPVHSETLANGIRKATADDPDGNTLSFFEAPGG
jgi:predicted enzyme related to lactoylglutathione lyase